MSRVLRCLVCVLWLGAVAAMAQPGKGVLLLPVEMPEHYNPFDSEALTRTLESQIRALAPEAKIVLARAADLTAYGYRSGAEQPPTAEMAEKLSRAYSVDDVAWVSIRFQPDLQSDTGALAVAGAVRFWDYHAADRRVVIDQPLSLLRMGHVGKPQDEDAVRSAARQLASDCVGDLAYQLVGLARHRAVKPPSSASSWSAPKSDPTRSRNYRAMVSATQNYQRAVRDQNLVGITSSQAAMTRAWTTLNTSEREAISANYPDLKEAMTQVPVYQYGGYYYGGYWSY